VEAVGRRERKKAQVRAHISDVATRLFAERGFDSVSVSEISEAADVARPTVFAYFPRKEDLVFDRLGDVAAEIGRTVRDAPDPIRAVLDLLASSDPPGGRQSTPHQQLGFWRLIAGSRALQARARELASDLESGLAKNLRERGVPEPDVSAALIAAAYRAVHLGAIRRLLAGEPGDAVRADRARRLAAAFVAVHGAIERLATSD
jgi:AcrR family transcriptional regulator